MTNISQLAATDYHRAPMRLLNRALHGANALGLARIRLDQDALLARAKKETGLGNFGDDSFLQPMQLLLQALGDEADLNPVGRFMNRANNVRILKHRLYVQDLLTRHPQILDRPMPDPVVIVGLARSGTTRLHRLLASDTHFLHLKAWETVFPVPYPECFAAKAAGKPDPRIKDLDALLHVFPNAKLIFSHRDPIKAVGSACSMTWNAIVRDSDSVTADWVGQEWLGKTERMLHKTLRVRDEMAVKNNQYDIQYADITADWQRAIEGIYDFLEFPVTEQARAAMQSWQDGNRQHQHGAHKYSLAQFGLDPNDVERRLSFYRERFSIPFESTNPHVAAAVSTGYCAR